MDLRVLYHTHSHPAGEKYPPGAWTLNFHPTPPSLTMLRTCWTTNHGATMPCMCCGKSTPDFELFCSTECDEEYTEYCEQVSTEPPTPLPDEC